MTGTIHVETSAFSALVQKMEDALTGQPMADANMQASSAYWAAMRARFDSASSQDGTWEELEPSTAKQHAARGDHTPHSLVGKSGELRDSLNRGHPNHIEESTPTGCIEGTEDPKARFHQDGTSRIPARPFVAEPPTQTLVAIKRVYVDAFNAMIRNSGFKVLNATQDELEAIFGIELI